MKCLHCGNKKPYSYEGYCEKCYQNLVSENIKLQFRIYELENQRNKKPKHMKEENFLLDKNWVEKHFPKLIKE